MGRKPKMKAEMVDSRNKINCNMNRTTNIRLPTELIISRKKNLRSKKSKAGNRISVQAAIMVLICFKLGLRVHEIIITQEGQVKK